MHQEFINKFKEAVSLENVKYYYHVTNRNPELILSEGLFMVEDKIYSTAIEIPEEFIENPIEYSEGEKGTHYRKNPNIIIIAIDIENEYDLIKPIEYYPTEWTKDVPPEYFIEPKYILGYIDTNNYDFILNEEYDLANELYLKLINN